MPPFTGAPPAALLLEDVLVMTAGALGEAAGLAVGAALAVVVVVADVAAAVVLAAVVDADDVAAAELVVAAAGAVVGVEVAPPQAARKAMPATERGAIRKNWRRLSRVVMVLLLHVP
ncbi:MAG: hypothetical protein ACTHNK_17060 [Thermomicrobiales bacterium]